MAISIAAIVLGGIALLVAISIPYFQTGNIMEASSSPQTKDIYLFSQVNENIDEDKFGIPPDLFSLEQIIVNKGDNVRIHYYNLEPIETQEHHTFTIEQSPYKMDYDINAGESTTIEFTASEAGIFEYLCTFHKPTMSGQLVVLE